MQCVKGRVDAYEGELLSLGDRLERGEVTPSTVLKRLVTVVKSRVVGAEKECMSGQAKSSRGKREG